MKRFIKNILVFTVIPIIVLLIFGYFYKKNIENTIDYSINPAVTDLYIGDSHIQKSVIDSLLPNSINVATSSESLYFTYYKLKKIIEENPNIETVYLGVGYHSFSDYYDAFIFGNHALAIAPKYFYTLDHDEQIKFLAQQIYQFPSFIKSLSKIGSDYKKEPTSIVSSTGYTNPFKNTKADKIVMSKRLRKQFFSNSHQNEFSELTLSHFYKIIEFCASQKCKLVLINTPIHSYYKRKIPHKFVEKYDVLIKENKLNIIDLSAVELSEEDYIPDGDHVSEQGAVKMTTILKSKCIEY